MRAKKSVNKEPLNMGLAEIMSFKDTVRRSWISLINSGLLVELSDAKNGWSAA